MNGAFILGVPLEYRNIMVFRSLVGFIGIQGLWNAAKYMPISLSSCIISTCPIWLAIIAHFYLGEKISKFDVFAIFTSFAGVLIINNPFG
jgi:drug/metabolite transporter (DMT)-like permease